MRVRSIFGPLTGLATNVTTPVTVGVIVKLSVSSSLSKRIVKRPEIPPPVRSTWKFPLKELSTVIVKGADAVLTGPDVGPVKSGVVAAPGKRVIELATPAISEIESNHLRNFICMPFFESNEGVTLVLEWTSIVTMDARIDHNQVRRKVVNLVWTMTDAKTLGRSTMTNLNSEEEES